MIANTAWRNPPDFERRTVALRRRPARPPARGRALGRPDPVPGVRGRRAHPAAGLRRGRRADRGRSRQPPLGPAGAVRPDAGPISAVRRPPAGARRSASAGDVALFVSDAWHRGMPAQPDGRGRFFLQVHYGRRDIAQRLRTTDVANQLSDERRARRDRRARAWSACTTRSSTTVTVRALRGASSGWCMRLTRSRPRKV